ncbi:MAG: Probable extracellular nuclease [uncultured Corynebacteriales bacterium]|uniref:Probable extracellular nuclease n=1 Tax=uncultured Mycobacteriales bacterium TaxID=581187 RepID=A0A6J4J4L6_9ACTN|nr:MAG: Probable extracellular nuclease [uncultured Corynebacteriales bacterium]
MRTRISTSIGLTALAVASVAAVTAAPAGATTGSSARTVTKAHVDSLNNSGAHGSATVVVKNGKLNVRARVHGLTPNNAPHAQHIHFGEQARHECPTFRDDTNNDFRLNTAEGLPAYGPIRVSLTTRGDTSPASGLAVDRMPVARDRGHKHHRMNAINYSRYGIRTQADVLAGIKAGEAVYVIHGIDYNGNGRYDFNGAGRSELDPSLPAEATDPAACGVLEVQ